MTIQIAPSILNADWLHLKESLTKIKEADWIHLDIMDGHFVPNISFGIPIVKALSEATDIPLEAHLMVYSPEKFVDWIMPFGVQRIIIHVETTSHLYQLLEKIRAAGIETGVALNPGTAVESVYPCLPLLNLVLFMTVNPGFGGQEFIKEMLPRIKNFKQKINKLGYNLSIEVDGGINIETGMKAITAGADILVMGTSIFNHKNPEKYLAEVKKVFKDL